MTAEQLRDIENQEITRIVEKQKEIGLDVVTDGNSGVPGGIMTSWKGLTVWNRSSRLRGFSSITQKRKRAASK